MSTIMPNMQDTIAYGTGKILPSLTGVFFQSSVGRFRLASDPLFYANFTIDNIVSGTRYWIAETADLSNVLAEGVASGTTVTVTSMPSYANPMLVTVRLRKVGYLPFETNSNHTREGGSAYVIQTTDSIYQ